jgi:hypothetical protein
LQEIPTSFSPALRDLVLSCWLADPAQRPSFEKVGLVLSVAGRHLTLVFLFQVLTVLEKIKKEG